MHCIHSLDKRTNHNRKKKNEQQRLNKDNKLCKLYNLSWVDSIFSPSHGAIISLIYILYTENMIIWCFVRNVCFLSLSHNRKNAFLILNTFSSINYDIVYPDWNFPNIPWFKERLFLWLCQAYMKCTALTTSKTLHFNGNPA